MPADVRIYTLGLILEGDEASRFVEVKGDSAATGGCLIFTYADALRSPEVSDSWVENIEGAHAYFQESGWRIDCV